MTDDIAYGNREIADLLPWYETGRLDPADTARVEAALANDPALRRELDLVREERHATVAFNQALGTPSRAASQRLFTQLDASSAPRRTFGLAALGDILAALRPPTMAFATIAAIAVLVGQLGVIAYYAGRPGAVYESASAPQRAVEGPTLLVAFQPAASLRSAQALLETEGLSIISGPSAGYFTVRVAARAKSATDLDKLIARLDARRDVIRSVMRREAE